MFNGGSWHYIPGLMQLIEEGVDPKQFVEHEVFLPRAVRGGTKTGIDQMGYMDRLVKWLRGYRKDRLICERKPAWIPLAELWPPPEGEAEFTYETSQESEATAELSVFSIAGFGGASKRSITDSITMRAQECGRVYLVRVYLTIYRYVHKDNKSSFDCVDVDCSDASMEVKFEDLTPVSFPFPQRKIKTTDLDPQKFTVRKIIHTSSTKTSSLDTYAPEIKTTNSWSCEIKLPDISIIDETIKLGMETSRSQAFKVEFKLPRGNSYVFFSRLGEEPIVPLCANLV